MKSFSTPFFIKSISFLVVWNAFSLFSELNLKVAKQAEHLFHDKLYSDALPLYSQLFESAQQEDLKTQWGLRLATCYLEEKQPKIAFETLSLLPSSSHSNHFFFLKSIAHQELGQFQEGLKMLQQCASPTSEYSSNLFALEQGVLLVQLGDMTSAKKAFQSVSNQPDQSILYPLAQLQLAKILINHFEYQEALKLLNKLPVDLLGNQPLHIERIYLKGWTLLALQQEENAITCFEELSPIAMTSQSDWSEKILQGLTTALLRQAVKLHSVDQIEQTLSKADSILQCLIKKKRTESSDLLLSDLYLIKAKYLNDPESYSKALSLLEQSEHFSSPEEKRKISLKYSVAAPSYELRKLSFKKQLSIQPELEEKICFLKGMNDLEEGLSNQALTLAEKNTLFRESALAFSRAEQLNQHSNEERALTYKYLALAYLQLPDLSNTALALETLEKLIQDETLLSTFQYPEEIYCLTAWAALRLNDKKALQQNLSHLQSLKTTQLFWLERIMKLQGLTALQLEEWTNGDHLFEKLLQNNECKESHSEAWFWRAFCAAQQHQESLRKEYLIKAFTENPNSDYAPLAYFQFHSYRDYMQHKSKAIKHLQAMPHRFPNHRLLINAYTLIGLYYKKDHLSEEGLVIQRKSWTKAIDAFQQAESTFDQLKRSNLIPLTELSYYATLRSQAQFERAECNLAIAQQATGGKRVIYLEYAEEVFKQMIHDISKDSSPKSLYPKIWAEGELGLAQVYQEKGDLTKAEEILNVSLIHYQTAQINRGYGVMCVWERKGKLAQQQKQFEEALTYFLEAEEAIQEEIILLSPNEKLDLWIQQSLCYKELQQYDQSMKILSQVINDDVISPLRIKAMFLRAEIYELEGRPELAIKQLDATAQKGGEWAQQAKEKLEKIYGF